MPKQPPRPQREGPSKQVEKPAAPGVHYVYRKDAFKKVKIA
jgi:hypothetical protein